MGYTIITGNVQCFFITSYASYGQIAIVHKYRFWQCFLQGCFSFSTPQNHNLTEAEFGEKLILFSLLSKPEQEKRKKRLVSRRTRCKTREKNHVGNGCVRKKRKVRKIPLLFSFSFHFSSSFWHFYDAP